jgi:hypothetical protein
MKIFPQFNPVNLARWLIIALSITILFSPFLTNVLEIALFGLCLFNQELRRRFADIKNQPLVIGVGAFILMLIIGCFYSVADYQDTLRSLWGWRKILLLPIALSLFADSSSPLRDSSSPYNHPKTSNLFLSVKTTSAGTFSSSLYLEE